MPSTDPFPTPAEPLDSGSARTITLRRFGRTMGLVALAFAGFAFWRESYGPGAVLGAGAVFLLLAAWLYPRALDGPERLWMRLAHVLSIVSTFVILTLVYYLVVTPVGLLLRLFRQDVLGLKFQPSRTSYWEPVEPNGPSTRPDKPF